MYNFQTIIVETNNTLILVEHDMDVIAASDWVICIGAGAGDAGGGVVSEGGSASIVSNKLSRTAPCQILTLIHLLT